MSDNDVTSTLVYINGNSGKNCHYDAVAICKQINISDCLTAISGLTLGLEKVMYLKDNEEKIALTTLGVKHLIDGLSEKEHKKLDVKLLKHFDYDVEHAVEKSKQAAEKAAIEKPLEQNTLLGYLRTVYPDHKVLTNWVVPTTERTLDIYIPSNKKDSIAIICDSNRHEPLRLTPEETQTSFNMKATTQQDLQWLLFKDFNSKKPTASFFTLLSQINNILYGPLGVLEPEKKKRKPRKKTVKKKKEKKEKDETPKKEKKEKSKKDKKEKSKKEKESESD